MIGTQRSVPAWLAVALLLLAGHRLAYETGLARMPPRSGRISWLGPVEAAEIAKREGMPLLLDFSADWCPPCDRMDRETFDDPEVAELIGRRFVPARVLSSSRPESSTPGAQSWCSDHRVDAFPTIVVVLSDGTTRRQVGFVPAAETGTFLAGALHADAAIRGSLRGRSATATTVPR